MTTIRIRKLVVLALLAAIAVVGRVAFQGVPNIQPATIIIILTGMFLGWKMGLSLGVLIALVSGLMTGIGTWTPFQMIAWGLIGFISGFIPDHSKSIYVLWLAASAFLFGLLMAPSYLFFTDIHGMFLMYVTGLLFDGYHAIGNLLFGIFSPLLFKVFKHEQKRLEIKN